MAKKYEDYGVEAIIYTDIGRDGMLQGPDVDGLRAAALATTIPVIASGGVASLDDVRILATIPALAGVITGKAIYEGRFTVEQAVAALRDVNLGLGSGAQ